MPMSSRFRGVTSKRLTAALVGLAIALPLTITAGPSSAATTKSGGCPSSVVTARQARYNLLGYLWGDGHLMNGTFFLRARTACKAKRVAADIKAIGLTADTKVDREGTHFRIKATPPFNHMWETGVPADTASGVATSNDLSYFLAAVLEGEGTGSGQVLDDPNWGRTSGVVSLYGRMGVNVKPDHKAPSCGCATGSGYWHTFVDPPAPKATYNRYVAIIRSWPFADMGRVPKPR
jgi:hypothetical protein